ncbi:hypothetical protein AB3S75_015234 [Citrus x aurantiifolia]
MQRIGFLSSGESWSEQFTGGGNESGDPRLL